MNDDFAVLARALARAGLIRQAVGVLFNALAAREMRDVVDPTDIILDRAAVNRVLDGSTRPLSVRDDTIR